MNGRPFVVPYLANQFAFDPGPQPYDPGVSYTPAKFAQTSYTVKPWPGVVPTIRALLSSPGLARTRAPVPVVNNYGPNPENYLFIGGFVGKSKG